jgi:hypothetical protein
MSASEEIFSNPNMEDNESSEHGDNKTDVGDTEEANMFIFNYI